MSGLRNTYWIYMVCSMLERGCGIIPTGTISTNCLGHAQCTGASAQAAPSTNRPLMSLSAATIVDPRNLSQIMHQPRPTCPTQERREQ
jgi:hypothetical protein